MMSAMQTGSRLNPLLKNIKKIWVFHEVFFSREENLAVSLLGPVRRLALPLPLL